LHVAPEAGLTRILTQHGNIDYLTADITPGRAMVRMDITEIGYPDNSFDAIICNHVLEHITDDRKAMRELHRVLRSGGWGILQVPISLSLSTTHEDFSVRAPADRERIFGQADHVRLYAIDYLDRLKESGFETVVFDWQQDETFSAVGNRYGLLPREQIFVVRKPDGTQEG
jgi:ubiquinone/menaquinone biosynthesis C-methylase UbiE